ncbi:GntR family transcriptional regulator [Streptomyces sp. H27-D2]|uniref:GntR family transcriptional regulator n=1 Tax=Streptomyces sp. H27-D2 TaxID=3046304 RepID=UPI002DBBE240|nr:UTRA domain-containing protein [Streptomyces sp. H27-D2]MEC4016966.1 UTRA domain-containing protein [Streptomyces sp. H27-D2]
MAQYEWESESARYLTPGERGAPDAWAREAAESNRRGGQRLLDAGAVIPPADVARGLGLADDEEAIVRRRLILLDGAPVELADSYYPARIAAGTGLAEAGKVPGGAVSLLAELGYVAGRAEESVTARMPSEAERAALGLGDREPVMVLSRIVFAGDERPMEACVMTMTARDRAVHYRLRLG